MSSNCAKLSPGCDSRCTCHWKSAPGLYLRNIVKSTQPVSLVKADGCLGNRTQIWGNNCMQIMGTPHRCTGRNHEHRAGIQTGVQIKHGHHPRAGRRLPARDSGVCKSKCRADLVTRRDLSMSVRDHAYARVPAHPSVRGRACRQRLCRKPRHPWSSPWLRA